MDSLVRVGAEALPEMLQYLNVQAHESIFLLSDLQTGSASSDLAHDPLSIIGYRRADALIAVQGFYRYGRWFPHFTDPVAIHPMIDDVLTRRVRWVMGMRRIVDPLLDRLVPHVLRISYDEQDYLCYVEQASYRPFTLPGVRPAIESDIPNLATLRRDFEHEYFQVPLRLIDMDWCFDLAMRYVSAGAHVAERDGQVVSMVAVEARLATLTQVGAVYTRPAYRGQGLARAVVSALCAQELARVPQVALTVRTDNGPALSAYAELGFRRWDDYRMARLNHA
jgi:ribosomal protein S18 acetylase RimI-like enzyme